MKKATNSASVGVTGAIAALGVLACVSFPGGAFAAEDSAINVNSATGEALAAAMSGVGATLGKAIVEYRRLHGPFRSIDEMVRVRGIGVKLLDRSRDRLRVGDSASKQPVATSN